MAVALLVASARTGNAQDDDIDLSAAAAYFAITSTTVGAAPFHAPVVFDLAAGRRIRAQFGYADQEGDLSHRALLLALDLPGGGGAFSVEGGLLDATCDGNELAELGIDIDCGSMFMVGARWSGRLFASALGESGAQLHFGLDAGAGASFGDYVEFSDVSESVKISATNFAAGLSMPIGIVARAGTGSTVIPTIAPGVAFGRSTLAVEFQGQDDDVTESGARFMLSAGLGLLLGESGFALDVGVRKVFADDAPVVIGVGASRRLR